MQNSKSSPHQCPEAESDDALRFDKSLKELRDLRPHLHYAADYCEMTFFNAKQKKMVVENTKEYICRAVVTLVDHLGSVSANLDCRLSSNNAVSEAELRIDCMKQRLLMCEQYAQKLDLAKVRWSENLPRLYPRYITSPIPNLERSNGLLRDSDNPISTKIINKHEFDTKEEIPLFLYTYTCKPSLAKNLMLDYAVEKEDTNSVSVLPVNDGLSIPSKALKPSFHFQAGTRKLGRNMLNKKSVQISNDILSLIRRRPK